MNKTVTPGDLHGELRVLPSKSASHRAVMMAALARGKTLLEPMQLSKDIGATLACAQAIGLTRGAAVAAGETEGFVRAEIWGGGEAEKRPLRELDCGESGSTLRFFIPLALDGRGPVRLIGHGRLMQRPLTVYQNLFAPLGVVWRQAGDALTVEGELKSGRFELPGDVSSQFITGLLLALPRLEGDSEIVVTTPLESRAYVELTRRVQRDFGVTSAWRDGGQTLLVRGGQEAVSPGTLHIEGDWSHAAFYLVAGAIGRGEIRLTGLDPQSAQGDRAVVEILRDMGADIRWEGSALVSRASRLHGLRVDCAQIPDLVPILAVAMAAAEGEPHHRRGAAAHQGERPAQRDGGGADRGGRGRGRAAGRTGDSRRKAAARGSNRGLQRPPHRDGDGDSERAVRRRMDDHRRGGDGEIRPGVLAGI